MLVPTLRGAHRQPTGLSTEGQISAVVIAPIHCNAVRRFTFLLRGHRSSFCDDHTVCPWDKVNRGDRPMASQVAAT